MEERREVGVEGRNEVGGKGFIHGLGTYATRGKSFWETLVNTTDEESVERRAGQVEGTYIERFEDRNKKAGASNMSMQSKSNAYERSENSKTKNQIPNRHRTLYILPTTLVTRRWYISELSPLALGLVPPFQVSSPQKSPAFNNLQLYSHRWLFCSRALAQYITHTSRY
ncbi:hypothetical protein BGX38DRAFT_114398 [Terfezia claveryi]|nr:hypothetical protein BGX38DRAFT_114398 [Terfezia claveryi]